MTQIKTHCNRRSFLKVSATAGGGMMIGFSWLAGPTSAAALEGRPDVPEEWFDINGYIRISNKGIVTIFSPNPEIGQNVMTSMPMIVADELDVSWENVVVEQGMLDEDAFNNPQFAGGSLSIMLAWNALRMAGAAGKYMLTQAAAREWGVSAADLVVSEGVIREKNGSRSIGYGEIASKAVDIEVPAELTLKDPKDFTIIGTAKKNVRGKQIVTGQPQFGLDFQREGMKLAMIHHPPAFGQRVIDFNVDEIKAMPGVTDAFMIDTSHPNPSLYAVNAFNNLVAIVGDSTWQLVKAKKAIKARYETVSAPESTEMINQRMLEGLTTGKVVEERFDGDAEAAFALADKVIERTYTAAFLPHNCLEPLNFFAHVTNDAAELVGPTQTPKELEKAVSSMLGLPVENVTVEMTRIGGGFGRRLLTFYGLEAAAISEKAGLPIKLIYSREDDTTQGSYRSPYLSTYKAGLDADNQLIAFAVKGVAPSEGRPTGGVFPNRFPAGAVDNYSAEKMHIDSNITMCAWRAPRSHFAAAAEQSFLDEVAEAAGKDPIEMRLELFERVKRNPVGAEHEYDADRYAGVLKLVKEKSGWGSEKPGVHRGVSAYFCHNTYAAQVLDIVMEEGKPVVDKVWCAVDCGIVVNYEGARNVIEGGIVDGIGHAMVGELTFESGIPKQENFDTFQIPRHTLAPREIEVFFVESEIAPTGLGEPGLPPAVGALANALYKATGVRHYHTPFSTKPQDQQS
ncbi:MAG: xanthine dehydrogenase family protein molybdopterin-binding subunit [Gammaproteobacteria bacterium]|nr:xanthine dehydrogenase family protein molybdopterin-binding subunit [Gammaproteobacteria bacterium]